MREDLRALDDDKLAQLANRGLVKRARKMLDAQTTHQVSYEDDGTLVLSLEGIESRLPPGVPLNESDCSCGARGVCRHLLFAVMAHNAESPETVAEAHWNPGDLSDQSLEELLGSRAFSSARRLAGKGMQMEVRAGPPPVGLLPTCTVTFLVPHSLAHAACDCATSGPCEHLALAVWGFRRADPTKGLVRVDLGGAQERHEALDEAHDLVKELLADGTPGARQDLPDRLRRAAKQLAATKMVWMKDLLDDVAAGLTAYRDRAAHYDPLRVRQLHTEWFARERASHGRGELNAALVLGLGEAPETALEHTRLTSLGVRLVRRKEKVYAEVFLADPDTSTVVVLNKDWSAETAVSRVSVQRGMRFEDLAAGQLVTSTAKRRANRTLQVGRSRVAQSAVFAQTGEWDKLLRSPLLVTDLSRLGETFGHDIPSLLRPRVRAERVHVLQISEVDDVRYDSGSQTLWARLTDDSGGSIQLRAEYSAAAPGALPSLFQELHSNPKFVSGEVSLERWGLTIEPLAVVSEHGLTVPALQPEQPMKVYSPASRDEADPFEALLEEAAGVLTGMAHRGLSHHTREEEFESIRGRLQESGLRGLAGAFGALKETVRVLHTTGRDAGKACEAWADASIRLTLTRESWLKGQLSQTSAAARTPDSMAP